MSAVVATEDTFPAFLRETFSQVTFGDWRLLLGLDGDRWFLQWQFVADNAVQRSRKWPLSRHMTKSELVQTALKAALTAVEHEAREKFLYRSRPVFGPHYDVDKLHSLCGTNPWEVRS